MATNQVTPPIPEGFVLESELPPIPDGFVLESDLEPEVTIPKEADSWIDDPESLLGEKVKVTDNPDAILNTAIQSPELVDETIANVINATPKQFDQKQFESNLHTIGSQTEASLKKYYNTDDVRVVLNDSGFRPIDKQQEYLASGASRTPLSLHNFGAGGDYDIYINGDKIDATGKSKELKHSVEPYQILGGVAKQYGYFWGWGHDSRHVASHRFVNQLIEEYPHLADSDTAKNFYEQYSEQAPKKLEPILSTLDNIYGQQVEREYTGEGRTLDPLLNPISVTLEEAEAEKQNIQANKFIEDYEQGLLAQEQQRIANLPKMSSLVSTPNISTRTYGSATGAETPMADDAVFAGYGKQ